MNKNKLSTTHSSVQYVTYFVHVHNRSLRPTCCVWPMLVWL